MEEKENTRLLVLETLLEVEKRNIFVKDALHKQLFQKQFLSKQERAFISRMVEGVTEYQIRLDYVIDIFSKTKVEKCKSVIRCVLRMGVYQMLYMDGVPDETACDECVKLAKKKGFYNLAGFVNGVLRNVARNKETIEYPKREDDFLRYLSITYSMPVWLVKEMVDWYGGKAAENMLEAFVMPADLTIRINENKILKEALKAKLSEKQIVVREGNYVEEALHLEHINYVKRLPGFKEGEFFIQDESSMLLYHLSGAETFCKSVWKKDQRIHILELCAAPGGKCTHFAEKLGDRAQIVARDLTKSKVSFIDENIARLGLHNIETDVKDALIFDEGMREWADVVIADLPCSGLGIIAKKNDIKYHISKEQLIELSNLQRTILTNASAYVKPGGILLYSTCTINPEENIENAKWFLEHFDFLEEPVKELLPEKLRDSVQGKNMVQLLPGIHKCDGFFIAKFRKK
ncbi:MAG: 16S rRNA (cytosine(967)-C(5))-methyltransferase RsmB [Lachnospiraceae bacterium]|nr:16S rRNA (cytosine(967)-C(5))-methyltransferase RsmB [Lachnospiraceae bacterium]